LSKISFATISVLQSKSIGDVCYFLWRILNVSLATAAKRINTFSRACPVGVIKWRVMVI